MPDDATQLDFHDILPPSLAVHAMRAAGYKDTAHAVAELIDNSIQAGSLIPKTVTEVEVLCIEKPAHLGSRTVHRLTEIAVFDNATGMDPTTLRKAMQFGQGAHLDKEKQTSMGKFGMGLPNASVSQCRRVEVYSWQKKKCHNTYLDIDEIKAGDMREVPEPKEGDIPAYWRELISTKIRDSGTLVVWKNIDRSTWFRSQAFFKNAEFIVGRMYRYFFFEGTVRIRFAAFTNLGGTDYTKVKDMIVRPNDPLMLSKDTMAPEPYDKEPAFVQWDEPQVIEIETPDGEQSKVKVTYSLASENVRDTDGVAAGATPVGKFVAKNLGVSIVRAGRELELNTSWNNPSEPRERWWGIEISFEPSLDDIFGVTNTKQSATKLVRCDIEEDAKQEGLSVADFIEHLAESEDPRQPIYMISTAIKKRIDTMNSHIRRQREGQRKATEGVPDEQSAEARASRETLIRKEKTGKVGRSDLNEDAPAKDKQKAVKEALEESGVPPEDAQRIAVQSVRKQLRYVFTNADLASPAIFDIQEKLGELFIKVNSNHPAYEHFFSLLQDASDEEDDDALTGLKLLLTAWARMEDEAGEREVERLQETRITWGQIARDFIRGDSE